ncbi:UBP9-binding protein [Psilocybe cubensis]|uniref:WD40 repeat-like protein n=2 Tax=Psilocybe cubensis TaxID=181762 RepID=A0A8H7XPY2_PSICU|nr:UBP9-binding protein [Psilocybe cubensis]KAH9475511.1 UBP9-binding protein [Psilocybe cubensis]
MVQPRRRVSYIIPSPSEPPPRLQLPPHGVSRLGATGPLLTLYNSDDEPGGKSTSHNVSQPRHRLGVASLALDLSTQLIGRNAPEGILYSGGRDGLVMSWDLGITMKKKFVDTANVGSKRGRWEAMTGWGDDSIDEEAEDGEERLVSDGDILGDVTTNADRRRRAASVSGELPHERQWETDILSFKPGMPTQFRQCAQAHADWVNDILLCNYNQTVVSASSDGTVKVWNPHASVASDPSIIGSHSDYVRCLTHCREQSWVASGSFDRTIKLWDLGRPPAAQVEPLVTLNPPDATAPKSSVYALAADPYGKTIASGSPERVVRLWDPRTGKRTGKLVGHTDNIRAILISDDSKYLLTGSADASIKLWSLSSQRCLHTFTHHTDSVWSLFSDHPSLETFYSGDRSGLVCRVDVEGSPDISEGECVVLCNDAVDQSRSSSEGINKIVVMDDHLLWTASGSSSIKRWNIPQRRVARAIQSHSPESEGQTSPNVFKRRALVSADSPSEASTRPSTGQGHSRRMSFSPSVASLTSDSERWRDRETDGKLNGLPYDSLVKLVSPNDSFTPYSSNRNRDPEVATLYSAASVMSVPRQATRASVSAQTALSASPSGLTGPLQSSRTEETVLVTNTSRALYEDRELAADAIPLCTDPDGVIPGDHGLVRSVILNDRINALTVDTAGQVAVWDIVRGQCLGLYRPEDVAAASHAGSTANGAEEKERSPREALEAVRERIEGEGVISSWCMADTKCGVLTIHLSERCFDAEVYADEVGFAMSSQFSDESKLNVGKWVLRNLFIGFIQEELRLHQSPDKDDKLPGTLSRSSSQETIDPNIRNRLPAHSESTTRKKHRPRASSTVINSPDMIPATQTPNAPVRSSPLLTPLIPLHTLNGIRENPNFSVLPPIPQSPPAQYDVTPTPGAHQRRARSGTIDGGAAATPIAGAKDDYFSARTRQPQGGVPASPDDFSGWTGPNKAEPATPSTPSGLMGRLRNFGKIGKRPVSDVPNVSNVATPTAETPHPADGRTTVEIERTPLQTLLSAPLTPPSSADAPLHPLSPQTIVLISEEAQPSYTTLYRRDVAHIHEDIEALENAMPMWLTEYLLLNKIPLSTPLAKLSFVLMPWNKDPDVEPLPELLNTTQSKLTANRYLRVRKIVNHVQDKLEKMAHGSRAGSIRSSIEDSQTGSKAPRPRAEDEFEILCNEVVLPLGMSLAAVRQYVWKSGNELVMHYRRKRMTISGPLQ